MGCDDPIHPANFLDSSDMDCDDRAGDITDSNDRMGCDGPMDPADSIDFNDCMGCDRKSGAGATSWTLATPWAATSPWIPRTSLGLRRYHGRAGGRAGRGSFPAWAPDKCRRDGACTAGLCGWLPLQKRPDSDPKLCAKLLGSAANVPCKANPRRLHYETTSADARCATPHSAAASPFLEAFRHARHTGGRSTIHDNRWRRWVGWSVGWPISRRVGEYQPSTDSFVRGGCTLPDHSLDHIAPPYRSAWPWHRANDERAALEWHMCRGEPLKTTDCPPASLKRHTTSLWPLHEENTCSLESTTCCAAHVLRGPAALHLAPTVRTRLLSWTPLPS